MEAHESVPQGAVVPLDVLPGTAAIVDAEGFITATNAEWDAFATENGLAPAAAGPGTSYFDVADDELAGAIADIAVGRRRGYSRIYPCHGPDAQRWFKLTVRPVAEGSAVVLHEDVTDDHVRLEQLISGVAGSLIEIGPTGQVAYLGSGWEQLVGAPVDADTWLDPLVPQDRERVLVAIERSLSTGEDFSLDCRVAARAVGDDRFVRLVARSHRHDSSAGRLVVVALDVTAETIATNRLSYLASHDVLTGLANRSLWAEHLDAALRSLRRPANGHVFVLFLDVDGFKAVNDSLGHVAGDAVLVQVADRIQEAVRPDDIVGRYGGDEFVVLVSGWSDDLGRRVAARIRDAMAVPMSVGGRDVQVSVSIGVAGTAVPVNAQALIRRADERAYAAKQTRRGIATPAGSPS